MIPRSKMAIIAICFALGIAAAANLHPVVWICIASVAAFCLILLAKKIPRFTVLIGASVYILGAVYYTNGLKIPSDDVSRFAFRAESFEGVIASDPESNEDRIRLVCRVERVNVRGKWHKASGQIMVNLYPSPEDTLPTLDYGDQVRLEAVPYPPRDPTNPGQFSWRDYLARQSIYSCAYVNGSSQVHVIKSRKGNILLSAALKAKHYMVRSIARITPKREASVLTGMVLGTYSYLPKDTLYNFQRTGTLHLLAASGFNCYILLILSMPILKRTSIMPKYRNEFVIILVGMYLLMVGPKPSLIRASLMAFLLLMAPLVKRVPNTKTLFFVASTIILAFNPSYLFDIGFQLSFSAVWALISVAPVIESILTRTGVISKNDNKKQTGRFVWLSKLSSEAAGAGVATLSITLFTAPIVAYYFNYFSLVSLPANMALALGVPILFTVGLLSPALALIPVVGAIIGSIGGMVTHAMLWIVDFLGSWEHAVIAVRTPGLPAIVGYYMILHAVLSYARSRFAAR
jgi:competence protein ComEC